MPTLAHSFDLFGSNGKNNGPINLDSPSSKNQGDISSQLDVLTREVRTLQHDYYSNKNNGRKRSQAEQTNNPSIEVRILELEEQIQKMNGRLEEAEFTIQSFAKKLDKIIADIDFRISNIEETKEKSNSLLKFQDKKQPNNIPEIEKEKTTKISDEAVQKEYDKAFGLLRQAKYKDAERALKAFIKKHKTKKLTSNAYYWLGETYYVQQNYEQAAVHFLKTYQDFPKGNKRPDSLLKLGISLAEIGKKKEACTTFKKLEQEFPKSNKKIKDRLAAEKKQHKC